MSTFHLSPIMVAIAKIRAAEENVLQAKRALPEFHDDVLRAIQKYQDDIFTDRRLVDFIKDEINEFDFPQSYKTVKAMFDYADCTYTEKDIQDVGYSQDVIKEEASRYED